MLTSYIPHGTDLSLRGWVIDSGVSHHVTHEKDLYVEYRSLDRIFVKLPNGVTVKIEGIGFLQLIDSLALHNILYIPKFIFNLLTVSVITKTVHFKSILLMMLVLFRFLIRS